MVEGIVPKIYLCGDKEKFFAWIGQRPFDLRGVLKFFGDDLKFKEDGKFLLDDKILERDELKKILADADFIVFWNAMELKILYLVLKKFEIEPIKFITRYSFKHLPTDHFYDLDCEVKFMHFLKVPPIKTLLDADAHFLKSPLMTKLSNTVTEMDCITQEVLPPIKENIYTHVYKDFADCCLKHYDAVLINANTPQNFIADYSKYEKVSDLLITYVRNDSSMNTFINNNKRFFEKINILKNTFGSWFFCYRHPTKKDIGMYAVTHKKLQTEHVEKLPEGYKIIHAGRAIAADLGYLGDNTGDNISNMNGYINELTAFYWLWRNTNHTIVGTAHYRRFLTTSNDDEHFSYDKILTLEQVEDLLSRYDVLASMFYGVLTEFEEISLDFGENVALVGMSIIEKHMAENQPDYVDAFKYVMNSTNFYRYNIIVTRKQIFDAYYTWLFSFFLKATNEISKSVDFGGKSTRLAGFFGERMLTVWLIKNHLRVKDLGVMKVPDM